MRTVITTQLALLDTVPAITTKVKHLRAQTHRERVMRVLMLGAGVQSSTLVEMMIADELERADLVVFADTGDEPRAVYRHLEHYLVPKLTQANIAFHRVQYSDLVTDLTDPENKFVSIPLFVRSASGHISQTKRQCTREYKITPANTLVKDELFKRGHATRYMNHSRHGREYECTRVRSGVKVDTLLGISFDERERAAPAREAWRQNAFPLIDRRMTRNDCLRWLRAHGCQIPPKSSCKRCPYHSDLFWLQLDRESPDEFEEVCTYDDWLRTKEGRARMRGYNGELYVHSSGTALRDRPFATAMARQHSLFVIEQVFGSCSGDGGFSCDS